MKDNIQIRLGFCVNNDDPTNQGKITCKIPSLNINESSWINRCGLSRSWSIPQVGSLVMLLHEEGDQEYIEYIGTSTKQVLSPVVEPKPSLTKDDIALYIDNDVYIKMTDAETMISQASTYLKLELAVATLESNLINLGSSATEAAVLGDTFKIFLDGFITLFNTHTHGGVTTGLGNTATPSATQIVTPPNTLSVKVKIE